MNFKEFLETLIKNIVRNPENVLVQEVTDDHGLLLELWIDPSDMGYVMGKESNRISSIRTLFRMMGYNNNVRIGIKVYQNGQETA